MNPLDQYPSIRKFLYTVQWIYNGLAALVGAYFTVNGTALDSLPKWYVLALGIAPVFWAYLGLTASANTPSVKDVQEGRADLNDA